MSREPFPPAEQLCSLIVERKRLGQKTMERLKRLERFGLEIHSRDQGVARRYIVQTNLKEMARLHCPRFIESGLPTPPCLHQVNSQCLLKMDPCPGRCADYRARRKEG
jgi:hypothetical protein